MTSKNTNIIFWGASDFAVPALEALLREGYNITAVVTNPDEPVGRRQILTQPPVKRAAEKHHIPVFQFASLKNENSLEIENWKLKITHADIFIVAAYGKIIPKDILDLPHLGALNIHPSLLPRWRGPSPIQFTILNGDAEAGVTIIKMDELMDHGPIVATQRLEISNSQNLPPRRIPGLHPSEANVFTSDPISKIKYQELHDELAELSATLLIEILPKYLSGEITPREQNHNQATYSKILTREDGRIDWKKSAEDIERMIRAFSPWPSAWTTWPDKEKIYRIRIEEADVLDNAPVEGGPSFAFSEKSHPLCLKTGKGSLAIHALTLEGKQKMAAHEFVRGHRDIIGSTLI